MDCPRGSQPPRGRGGRVSLTSADERVLRSEPTERVIAWFNLVLILPSLACVGAYFLLQAEESPSPLVLLPAILVGLSGVRGLVKRRIRH